MRDQDFRRTFNTIFSTFPFYRRKIDVDITRVRTVDDLRKLPFVTREDITEYSENYTEYLPRFRGCYIESTSGTTGPPKRVLWSYKEFEEETRKIYNFWKLHGLAQKGNRLAISLGVPGIGHQIVLHSLILSKADTLPLPLIPSPRLLADHVRELVQFRPTGIVTAPTLMIKYSETATSHNISLENIRLRKVVVTGEPLTKSTRKRIAELWGIDETRICDGYCTTEASTVGYELPGLSGIYVSKRDYVIETFDASTGHPIEREGELVITKANRYSFPHLRYKIGDVGKILGEDTVRGERYYVLDEIRGRVHDSIRIHTCTIYGADIEDLLFTIDHEITNYQVHFFEEGGRKKILVRIESSSKQKDTLARELEQGIATINEDFEALVGSGVVARPEVMYVATGTIRKRLVKEWILHEPPQGLANR